MPVVRMPDEQGTLVRFPDEMPEEEIRQHILSKFPNAAEQASSSRPANGGTPVNGPWERYQQPLPQSPSTGQQGAQIPAGYRVVSTPHSQIPPGFRVMDQPSDGPRVGQQIGVQPGFSDLRDAGAMEQTPGNEDLWAPSAAPQPPAQSAPQSSGPLNPVAGVARDLVEGIPIAGPLYTSAVDHIGSNVIGAVAGEDPAALRDGYQERLGGYREEHPILSAGSQIAGGTAAMAPLAMTPVGQAAFGMTGPLLQRAGLGAVSGGVIGGADSVARGGDVEDAWKPALGGAAGGAVGAVAAPHIGRAMGATGNLTARLVSMITGRPQSPVSNISRPALDTVVRALDADGSLSSQGAVNISRGGPNSMLVDAGPNAQSLLDTSIQRSGPGATAAMQAIETRASQANDDIARALSESLGEPRGVYTTQANIRQGSAPARSTAYDMAYAQPIDYSSQAGRNIEDLLQRVPQPVIDTANRMMAMEGYRSSQILADFAEDGTIAYFRQPDVRQIDYITRALNQSARSGEGQGALGGQTDIGHIYQGLSKQLRSATREAAPAYGEALETAAGPIQQREALMFGERLLRPSLARDEAADIVSGMTGPERQAAMQGVRSYIDEVLANVRAVASDPNLDAREARKALQDLSSRAVQDKIRMVIGDGLVSDSLFRQLDQASQALGLRASVAGNSRTYARTAVDQMMDERFNQGTWNQLLQGKPVNAGQQFVQNLTGRTPEGVNNLKDKTYAEIVQLLTNTRGEEAINLLQLLMARRNMPQPSAPFVPGLSQQLGQEGSSRYVTP